MVLFICIYVLYIYIYTYIRDILKLYVIYKVYVHGKNKNKMEKTNTWNLSSIHRHHVTSRKKGAVFEGQSSLFQETSLV